jgi:hypothetical protein
MDQAEKKVVEVYIVINEDGDYAASGCIRRLKPYTRVGRAARQQSQVGSSGENQWVRYLLRL